LLLLHAVLLLRSCRRRAGEGGRVAKSKPRAAPEPNGAPVRLSVTTPAMNLRALPVHVVELPTGIVLKRSCTELKVEGEDAAAIVMTILRVCEDGASRDELLGVFPAQFRGAVAELLDKLVARRLVVEDGREPREPEEASDVFYWNFDLLREDVEDVLRAQRISVLGVNAVSQRLVRTLRELAFRDVTLVDEPLLRNLELEEAPDAPLALDEWLERDESEAPSSFVVATSDFGAMHALRRWNSYCVERAREFLPIVLRDLVGYVGPLVVPGETACYECLRARENSHLRDPEVQRATDHDAFAGRAVQGFVAPMASILADVAGLELLKWYGRIPRGHAGALIRVNLLVPALSAHTVLKVPRCSVCSSLNELGPISPNRFDYLPPNRVAPV
jgi:molybdopterin-synthase adenylyltransferase